MKRTFKQIANTTFQISERFFLTGILTLFPVGLTIFVFYYAFRLLYRMLSPLHDFLPGFLQNIPYSEFIFAAIIIFTVGAVVNIFFLHSMIEAIEKLVSKIPLVRQIYSGLKQLIGAFTKRGKQSFQEVVLVEFPRPGAYSIAFITGTTSTHLLAQRNEEFYNLFVPTTPNPTTGFFLVAPKKDVITTTLTRQDAMAIIISGGLVQPEESEQK